MKKQRAYSTALIHRLFWPLLAVVLVVFSRAAWLPLFGQFLLVPDHIQKADAILVLRSEEFFRLQKAAELYHEGIAPTIVLSLVPPDNRPYDLNAKVFGFGNLSEKEITLKYLSYFSVPSLAVEFTGKETTSTYEEALAAREVALKSGYHSLLLVTSTYHMRRALYLFHKVFRGTDVRIYNATAAHPLYVPIRWWTRERDIRRVSEEYSSFFFNWFYHLVLHKNRTAFDTV